MPLLGTTDRQTQVKGATRRLSPRLKSYIYKIKATASYFVIARCVFFFQNNKKVILFFCFRSQRGAFYACRRSHCWCWSGGGQPSRRAEAAASPSLHVATAVAYRLTCTATATTIARTAATSCCSAPLVTAPITVWRVAPTGSTSRGHRRVVCRFCATWRSPLPITGTASWCSCYGTSSALGGSITPATTSPTVVPKVFMIIGGIVMLW